MRPLLKVLSFCAIISLATPSFADDFRPALQINYGKYASYGTIDFEHTPSNEIISEDFLLEAQSIEIRYVYSAWTAISASYHLYEECRIEKAKTKLGCHFDTQVDGANLAFLTGVNMDGQGLYFYSGIGVAVERIGEDTRDDIYTPFGVGINIGKFVTEISTEIRSVVDNGPDAYEFDVFSELDSDYILQGEKGTFAKTQPIVLSVGVRF